MTPKTIGERIEYRLSKLGYSKADLARACSVSKPSVSDWVNGESKRLNAENLLVAAEFLECTPIWLLKGVGLPHSSPIVDTHTIREPQRYYGDPIIAEAIHIMERLEKPAMDDVIGFLRILQLKKYPRHSENLHIPGKAA